MGLLLGSLAGILAAPLGLPGGTSSTLALVALATISALLTVAARAAQPPRLSWSALRSVTRQRSEQTDLPPVARSGRRRATAATSTRGPANGRVGAVTTPTRAVSSTVSHPTRG